nr:hypothetical protein [Tanacetum cinerariifolium]
RRPARPLAAAGYRAGASGRLDAVRRRAVSAGRRGQPPRQHPRPAAAGLPAFAGRWRHHGPVRAAGQLAVFAAGPDAARRPRTRRAPRRAAAGPPENRGNRNAALGRQPRGAPGERQPHGGAPNQRPAGRACRDLR